MKQILSLARLTGLSEEQLQEQLFEGDEVKSDWDETFSGLVLDKFKAQERKRADIEYGRGIDKKVKEVEEALKPLADKYGITFNRVEEGISQLAEKLQAEPPKGGAEDLTPEQLRNHPQFSSAVQQEVAAITEKMNNLKAKAAKAEEEKDKFIKEQQAASHADAVKARVRKLLKSDELNAAFGTDEEAALKSFFALYPPSSFQADGDKVTPVDENNQPITDKFGDPLAMEDFLREKWVFGFQSGGTKTPGPPPRGNGQATKKHFTSEQQFNELRDEAYKAGDWTRYAKLQEQFYEQENAGGFPLET